MFIFSLKIAQLVENPNKLTNKANTSNSIEELESIYNKEDILPPIQKGDINGDMMVNEQDLSALLYSLIAGDMNGDKKLDKDDLKILHDITDGGPVPIPLRDTEAQSGEQNNDIRPFPRVGDLNRDGKVDRADFVTLARVISTGDMNDNGRVNYNDVRLLNEEVNKPRPFRNML